MKKIIAVVTLLLLEACALANPSTGPGVLHTDVKELVYYDSTIIPLESVELCSQNYMGLVSIGDMGLEAVRKKSTIRKIASIEKTYSSSFLLSASSCIIVKGQR